jgi:dTDP-4-dehydrorhamnose reductase
MNRILITGGSGRLGSAIQRVCREAEIPCYAPSSTELDVLVQDFRDWWSREICDFTPTVMIHCAGFANALKAESARAACWSLNVEGTRNMVRGFRGMRFVYISTDYVFDGEEGNYSESDTPNPVNFYGASKLAGEMIVSEHENTLILRAPFRADPPWRFPKAFTDQWTSCRFASEVAPDVVAAALSNETDILHIGGPRRSIHELAETATPGMLKIKRADFQGLRIPRDTSLDSTKWHSLQTALRQSSQLAAIAT